MSEKHEGEKEAWRHGRDPEERSERGALGGFVAGTCYILQMPIYIILVGLIYLVEVLSVMIQVTYFKKTGGKRVFRMAPIHHHFELGGWSETKVVAVFTVITAMLALVGLFAI